MVETLLDHSTIQQTIFGSTGCNTRSVISFDFKNIADSSYQKIFSIGDFFVSSANNNTEAECEGVSALFNSTTMRVRFSRLGSFRRTFTLDIIDTNVWRHYDIVISDVGQVDIYIDKILQTYFLFLSFFSLFFAGQLDCPQGVEVRHRRRQAAVLSLQLEVPAHAL